MTRGAAVIGCGVIGAGAGLESPEPGVRSHAAAYVSSPQTTLLAVSDTNAARVADCSTRWSAAGYIDHRKMLAQAQPSLVSICTPDETHYEILRDVLAAPSVRGVLAEKPFTISISEAEQLDALAKANGVTIAVNHTRRYAESHRQLAHFLRTGGLGGIQTIGGVYTKGTLHNGVHWFDLARLLVGEVKRAWGRDALLERGPDPTLDAILDFENGAVAHLQASRSSAFTVFEMDVIGENGRVRLVDAGKRFEFSEVVASPVDPGHRVLRASDGLSGGLEDALLNAVKDLVDAVEGHRQPLSTPSDAIAAMHIAHAVRESARSGVAIDLNHP